jgi:hypothetical protein
LNSITFSSNGLNLVQIQKGANSARSDDTKGLKGVILDWITPKGQALVPPLTRNIKADRGFHHERTGELLCPTGLDWNDPEYVHYFVTVDICSVTLFVSVKERLKSGEMMVAGDQWPVFLYQDYAYDPEDPWEGLFRSSLLVTMCSFDGYCRAVC